MMKKLPLINLILLLSIIIYLFLSSSREERLDEDQIIPEITTERLNIVGKNGNKFIVLSNPDKQAVATINGEPIGSEATKRGTAGLLFFNEDGDEIGGLVYGIDSIGSYQLLTFDQRKNDQIMTLRKEENFEDGEWKRQYGLLLQERSEKQINVIVSELNEINSISDSVLREKKLDDFWSDPENLAPQRLFIGRTFSGDVGLYLMDKDNNPRLQIYVDREGLPHIESFDNEGNKKEIQ